MDLDMIVFSDFTLRQILYFSGGIVVAFIFLRIIKKLFFKPKLVLQHTIYYVCGNCQWEGHVSKFGNQCPKCGHPIEK